MRDNMINGRKNDSERLSGRIKRLEERLNLLEDRVKREIGRALEEEMKALGLK